VTTKADFSEEEWRLIAEAPPLAGLMVSGAQRGGTFREALSMGKSYTEARKQHGNSELLDELVTTRPKVEHPHVHSPEELRDLVLQRLREASTALRSKATEQEISDYNGFVSSVAEHVASSHSEGSQDVSDAERAAITAIGEALGAPAA
jgi:hypothetical protein